MIRLVFLNKNLEGKAYKLVLEKTTVGRASDNTLVIHDSSVSSHHCEILTYGEEVIIRERLSTNGTFINDRRISEQSQVKSGQVIRFGEVEVRLEFERPQRDRPDTEMTTVATLKEVGIERRKAAREADTTTHKEMGDQSADPESTAVYSKPKSGPISGGASPETHEPLHVLPEPKSLSSRWLTIAAVIVIVVLALIFLVWKPF